MTSDSDHDGEEREREREKKTSSNLLQQQEERDTLVYTLGFAFDGELLASMLCGKGATPDDRPPFTCA